MNVKIMHDDEIVEVSFNENGKMFVLESTQRFREGEIEAYCCDRFLKSDHNQCWLLKEFLAVFVENKIVEPVMNGANMVIEETKESEEGAVLCNIVHPFFNDHGYSPFGDFARGRLGQQCQYASRYIDGRLEGYPKLGEDIRFHNGVRYGKVYPLDATDYHSVRIHRDDMDEFERRYKAHIKKGLFLD